MAVVTREDGKIDTADPKAIAVQNLDVIFLYIHKNP